MKAREPRRTVLIQARIRVGASWSDAAILNLSPKGLLLHSPKAPPRGSYVEVRRGQYIIIARVVWTCGARAGLSSRDRLPVDALVRNPDAAAQPLVPGSVVPERRAQPRTEKRHEQSRLAARAFEFACIAILGAFAASLVYASVDEVLAEPLSRVSAGLGG